MIQINDTGDEFALRDGNSLFCKMDNDALDKLAQSDVDATGTEFRDGTNHMTSTTTTNSAGSNNISEFGSMSGEL
jgi:hypothetical protein